MKALIQGIGVLGAFGCGTAALDAALSRGPSNAPVPTDAFSAAAAAALAGIMPPRELRRVDRYSRMALLAAHLALAESSEAGAALDRLAVIVATGLGPTAGFLDTQPPEAGADELRLSPIRFSNSVHNAAAAYIAMQFRIRGPNLSINHYDLSMPLAVQTALDWLDEDRAAAVLVGGVDGFPEAPPPPGAEGREAPRPAGEGSAFFVLAPASAGRPARYPGIRDVRAGGPYRPRSEASGSTLYLHGGRGAEDELVAADSRRAEFSRLYGDFPTAVALDFAAAALLLEDGRASERQRALGLAGPGRPEIDRVRCLRKGVCGDCGLIEVGR